MRGVMRRVKTERRKKILKIELLNRTALFVLILLALSGVVVPGIKSLETNPHHSDLTSTPVIQSTSTLQQSSKPQAKPSSVQGQNGGTAPSVLGIKSGFTFHPK